MQDFYTPEQVAKTLKLSRDTVYNYIKSGLLPAVRIGNRYRVASEDLERFLQARKVAAGGGETR